MVRRGSTVRVRQRALQNPRSEAFFFQLDLQIAQVAVGMEPFMEPSGRERRSDRRIGSAIYSLRPNGTASLGDHRARL